MAFCEVCKDSKVDVWRGIRRCIRCYAREAECRCAPLETEG